ncbi:VRR-NUC domain-containing protein [Clostridium cochlearium]|nr:VRR-NUC domain-containing protein [Clostridium cochlearium]STA91603.1 VRR-NUC domain-containing protein [Clostridium cochlearium]
MFKKWGVFEILESKIEARLKREVEDLGGLALKFTSPGMAGVPDRLVLLPKGKIYFVELKAPGKNLRPLQLKRKEQLESLSFKVYVIDSYEKIDVFLQEVVD